MKKIKAVASVIIGTCTCLTSANPVWALPLSKFIGSPLLQGRITTSLNDALINNAPIRTPSIQSISTIGSIVSVTYDPNTIEGIASGGEFVASTDNKGLSSAVLPTIATSGLVSGSGGVPASTADALANWQYDVSVRQADVVNTAVAGGVIGAGTFFKQGGTFANVGGVGALGVITISAAGAVVANPGTFNGGTVKATGYTTISNSAGNNRITYKKDGTAETNMEGVQAETISESRNNSLTFDAGTGGINQASKAARYNTSGNLLPAMTGGGFQAVGGTLGQAQTFTTVAGAGGLATVEATQATGENDAVIAVSSTSTTQPSYAGKTQVTGGTDAGAITYTTPGVMSAAAGTAGKTTQTTCTAQASGCVAGSTNNAFVRVLSNGLLSAF